MTSDEYQAKRNALLAQVSGPDSVSFGDRSVKNRAVKDILLAISVLDAEWQRTQGTKGARIGRLYVSGEGK